MTEKRFTYKHFDWLQWHIYKDEEFFIEVTNCEEDAKMLCDVLNELHEEKEWLEMNNKDLVSFIKSKGYTLKDFLKYVGQFISVGVNKEDWND